MDIFPLDLQFEIRKRLIHNFKPKYKVGFTFGINADITLEWDNDLVESDPWKFLDWIHRRYKKSIDDYEKRIIRMVDEEKKNHEYHVGLEGELFSQLYQENEHMLTFKFFVKSGETFLDHQDLEFFKSMEPHLDNGYIMYQLVMLTQFLRDIYPIEFLEKYNESVMREEGFDETEW
jgi:hypothetical protein